MNWKTLGLTLVVAVGRVLELGAQAPEPARPVLPAAGQVWSNPPPPAAAPPAPGRPLTVGAPLPSISPAISGFPITSPGGPATPARAGAPAITAPIAPAPAAPPVTPALTALAFDAESKEYTAKPGEETAQFVFNVTNVSSGDVLIHNVRTSCGCTVAQLPSQPWKMAPGVSGPIKVAADLRGKQGLMVKSVHVDTSAGFKSLMIRVNIPDRPVTNNSFAVPEMLPGERQRNQITALGDRQAVFKGDCARCHLEPARGRTGPALYFSACSICHDAVSRASMVPDLRVAKAPRDIEYWRQWITQGKPGTLMPAWSSAHGGPLLAPQIDSLVDYLYRSFPRNPPAPARGTAPAAPVQTLAAPAPARP